MGILYNRFTVNPSSGSWTLIETFTEVNTWKSIDITGKTELLVVCNDIFSFLFCIRDIGSLTNYSHDEGSEKIYNTNTGTGYRIGVDFGQNPDRIQVGGSSWSDLTTSSSLTSINTKVYAR